MSAPPRIAQRARSNLEKIAGSPRCTKEPLMIQMRSAAGYSCAKVCN